tara:strand:+ start:716 stop:1171 length:456 start_codon:yes stop_codon:yes gene_type:complete
MAVNGSVTPVLFTLSPGTQITHQVQKLVLTLHSTSMDLTAAADVRVLGAAGALANGIRVYESRGAPTVDVDIFPTAVKKLVDFYRYGTVIGYTDGIAAGTDVVSITIEWPEDDPLVLRSRSTDTLTVRIADNLAGLALFEAHAIGRQFTVS